MAKLKIYESVSLDGYFCDANGDMSWAHRSDPEWMQFVSANATSESVLLFGRITFEQMEAFWPGDAAFALMPEVAKGMAVRQKLVCSHSRTESSWANTRFIHGDLLEEIGRLKSAPGPDVTILGSGTIVQQLAAAGLIDTYQLVVVPVLLGAGRSLFAGLPAMKLLQLDNARAFSNGNVVLTYRPK